MIDLFLKLFAVSILASGVGAVCGIGGGVVIKPVLDCMDIMDVSGISFLSGCTVLAMSAISVGKNMKYRRGSTDIMLLTLLAAGAAIGGIVGKGMFQALKAAAGNEDFVGMTQSAMLAAITAGTMIYSVNEHKIRTKKLRTPAAGIVTGAGLGICSSFLGIGGGPVNLAALTYIFSMSAREAVFGSLYIIMFSQGASLIQAVLSGTVPKVNAGSLVVMIAGGLAGGIIGSRVGSRISDQTVARLFQFVMLLIIGINIYNTVKFGGRVF